MKLAIMLLRASTGGWKFAYFLVAGLKKIAPDIEITFFTSEMNLENSRFYLDELSRAGVSSVDVSSRIRFTKEFQRKEKFPIKSLNNIYNRLRERKYKKYSGQLKQLLCGYDVVFDAWPFVIEFPIFLHKLGVPIFFIPHDFIFTHFFGLHSGNLYARNNFLHFKHVIGNMLKIATPTVGTPFIADELRHSFPQYAGDVHVVMCGISGDDGKPCTDADVAAVRGKYNINDSYVLYANNWALHKNMQVMVGAWYYIKQKHPTVKMLITGYGTEGIICKSNTALYWDHSCDEEQYDIKSLGCVPEDDLPAIMKGAKVVVNSSLCEAASGNSLDAWRVGTPVAMSDIPPFRQQVDFLGTKAEFFDPRDPKDAANAIIKLLDDPILAREYAVKSKDALSKYTYEDFAKGYLSIFEKAICGGGGG